MDNTGKSSLMSAIGNRELPIPDHIDIFHLQREMAPSEKTAIQAVMEVDAERVRLEHEAEQLASKDTEGQSFHHLIAKKHAGKIFGEAKFLLPS